MLTYYFLKFNTLKSDTHETPTQEVPAPPNSPMSDEGGNTEDTPDSISDSPAPSISNKRESH